MGFFCICSRIVKPSNLKLQNLSFLSENKNKIVTHFASNKTSLWFHSPFFFWCILSHDMERRYRTQIIWKRNVIFLQEALIYKANSLRYRQVYHSAINVWMHNGMQTLISIMCLDDALLIENCRWSQRRNLKQILLKFRSSDA